MTKKGKKKSKKDKKVNALIENPLFGLSFDKLIKKAVTTKPNKKKKQ